MATSPSAKSELLQRAIKLHTAGKLTAAENAYRQLLTIEPDDADALHLLGVVAHQQGRHQEAIELIERATTHAPNAAPMRCNLGEAYRAIRQFERAIDQYQHAVRLQPQLSEAHANMGLALQQLERLDEAIASFREAIRINPRYSDAHRHLARALFKQWRLDDAAAGANAAIAIDPNDVEALELLGLLSTRGGMPSAAKAYCRRAISVKPRAASAWATLGTALSGMGRNEEAIDALRKAVSIDPSDIDNDSALVYTCHLSDRISPEQLADEHFRWARQHENVAATPASPRPHQDRRATQASQLRIGYISPDFRQHSVSFFFETILRHFDCEEFPTTLYSNGHQRDHVTDRFRSLATSWRDISSLDDDATANLIRADEIDILIDLAGHSAGNRLLVFARKPAPVQATYLGYPNTTGLRAIDYRITDTYSDPPGATEQFHSEKLVRLPRTFLCYHPLADSPPVTESPVLKNKFVTFGSFNKPAKISPTTVRVWASVLAAVPNSRLVLKGYGFNENATREHWIRTFATHGVDPTRLDLLPAAISFADHLALYSRTDIALETFPYHGTTTTCEALWMGVPVVTLAGPIHVSRVGVSILSNLGLSELIAKDFDDYVRICVSLAQDIDRLQALPTTMRERFSTSPLGNGPAFVKSFESALREMWRTYCGVNPRLQA